MNKEKIRQYFLDFQKRDFSDLFRRDLQLYKTKKIQSILGARRVGKTSLLFSEIQKLRESQILPGQILYLNFENPLLNQLKYDQIHELLDEHRSLFPIDNEHLYLFIDEPQVIENWEIVIRNLYDELDCSIFITGSSSKLLSKEIATSLRGRSISAILYPLSFREFLIFHGFNADSNKLDSSKKAQLKNHLLEYIKNGGYPEVVLEKNNDLKPAILKDYYDMTIFKDIIDRYSIRNSKLIKWLLNYIVSANTKELSMNKIFNNLKSEGYKVGKDTLYEYVSMLEDCFFAFTLHKFDPSIKKSELTIPKVYLDDVGFMNLFSEKDVGKRIENIVFLELLRRSGSKVLLSLYYWKTNDGKEVDFLLTKNRKPVSAYQVCYSLDDMNTYERELNSLISCMEKFDLSEGTILTMDEQTVRTVRGKKIHVVPLYKWLLESGI